MCDASVSNYFGCRGTAALYLPFLLRTVSLSLFFSSSLCNIHIYIYIILPALMRSFRSRRDEQNETDYHNSSASVESLFGRRIEIILTVYSTVCTLQFRRLNSHAVLRVCTETFKLSILADKTMKVERAGTDETWYDCRAPLPNKYWSV